MRERTEVYELSLASRVVRMVYSILELTQGTGLNPRPPVWPRNPPGCRQQGRPEMRKGSLSGPTWKDQHDPRCLWRPWLLLSVVRVMLLLQTTIKLGTHNALLTSSCFATLGSYANVSGVSKHLRSCLSLEGELAPALTGLQH